MQLTKQEQARVAVKKSRNGKGIFAKKAFRPNQAIFQVVGQMVACDEDEEMDEEERDNTFRYSSQWYISPKGKLGAMLNHSCKPNAKLIKKDKKLFIVALLPIAKDTEVFIDYSTIIGSDDSWTMRCNCGETMCRKTIRSFDTLKPALKKEYKHLGMVPRHIG